MPLFKKLCWIACISIACIFFLWHSFGLKQLWSQHSRRGRIVIVAISVSMVAFLLLLRRYTNALGLGAHDSFQTWDAMMFFGLIAAIAAWAWYEYKLR